MADAHKNFASSLVATAPSPATSGTSLVVTTGDGTKFPAAPFNATVWPAGATPTTANAEIVRVTAVSTDTLTITRTQESTSARTVIVGDQIVAGITAKSLLDAEIPANYLAPTGASYETFPRQYTQGGGLALTSGTLYLVAIALPTGFQIGHLAWASTRALSLPTHYWFTLHDSSRVMLAATADQTTAAWAIGSKSLAVATIASGAASSFTTTYTGLHFMGIMVAATTTANLDAIMFSPTLAGLTPPIAGATTNTGLTTAPTFPFTAAAPGGTSATFGYGYVGP